MNSKSHGSFLALTAVDDHLKTFFCVYTPCGRRVLWCFGGKLAFIYRVAAWITWMLKRLEKGVCQPYGKARRNLTFFWPLQHPRHSDCHLEGGGSTFFQNFRIYKYRKAYKSARRPPNWGGGECTSTLRNFFSPPPVIFVPIRSRHSPEHCSQMHQHIQVIV